MHSLQTSRNSSKTLLDTRRALTWDISRGWEHYPKQPKQKRRIKQGLLTGLEPGLGWDLCWGLQGPMLGRIWVKLPFPQWGWSLKNPALWLLPSLYFYPQSCKMAVAVPAFVSALCSRSEWGEGCASLAWLSIKSENPFPRRLAENVFLYFIGHNSPVFKGTVNWVFGSPACK